MLKHVFSPATEAGRQLELTYEQEHLCKVLYRKTENGRYMFDGLWEPAGDYGDGAERIAVPLRSVIGPVVGYAATDTFANIIGSAKDPRRVSDSWIEVMRKHHIDCSSCATDGGFYDPGTGACLGTIVCKAGANDLVAGHVTFGIYNQHTEDIKGSTVYLLPICKKHNSTQRYSHPVQGKKEHGAGFYMKPKAAGQVLTLYKYFQLPAAEA